MIPIYVREKRHLNLVEMKRLMGFPDGFKFPVARTNAIKQLANAVCPPLISAIGIKIIKALNKKNIDQQVEFYLNGRGEISADRHFLHFVDF